MQDYLDATDAMAKEPYVDAHRLGAVGASYGGYSVFYLAGMHGGRFKAFISHCGMFNFTSGMVQLRNYGFLTKILKDLTGIIQKAISIHLILWLTTGIHQYL